MSVSRWSPHSGRLVKEDGSLVNVADAFAGGRLKAEVVASDSGIVDAFGRFRVSNPVSLFASQMQYDTQPLLWAEKIVGTGTVTHLPNESSAALAVGTDSGDRVVRQTYEYLPYQPGKSQQIMLTFVLGAAQSGTTKLAGYGDDRNGIFIGQDGGGVFVLLRSYAGGSASDARKVYQSEWSVDAFDGSGPSGETLDATKAQIGIIDIEWLGVGRVRVGFVVGGAICYAHHFLNANRDHDAAYMTTANLPVRYEIRNTAATASAATLKQICSQASSEGGSSQVLDYPFSAITENRTIPVGAENAVVIFAAKHALTFNGIENRIKWIPKNYEILPVGGRVVTKIIYNPTLTGGTFAAVDSRSGIVGATDVTSYTDGMVIESSISSGGSTKNSTPIFGDTFSSKLPFGLDVDGANPRTLALIAYALDSNVTASFAFQWEELR